jgi:carboxymethylenebutenolidase
VLLDGYRIGAIRFCPGVGFAVAWTCTDDRLKPITLFYARTHVR